MNAEGKTVEEQEQDNAISYADYLVQQAEKRAAMQAAPTRKANEGTKEDEKWANASQLKKEQEEFIAGGGTKSKRARERKPKEVIEIDQRFVEQPSREGGRGGARGGRGGGVRGGARGGRGAPRGGAPRGGAAAGGSQKAAPINPADPNAFPSLGA